MSNYLRAFGNKAPKGRNKYELIYAYIGVDQALKGKPPYEYYTTEKWCRNDLEALIMGQQGETEPGLGIGWKLQGFEKV